MAGVILNAGQRHVFDSVFKQHTGALSQPTPVVTPATAFTAPGQVFGGPQAFSYQPTPSPISPKRDLRSTTSFHADPSTLAQDQVRWDRSWHVVTHQLSLNKMSHHPIIDQLKAVTNSVPAASPEVQEALKDVLSPERRLPSATHTEELLQWYSQEVRSHFLHQVLPFVMNLMGQSKPEAVLPKVIQILDRAQGLYFNGMLLVRKQMEELNPGCSQKFLEGFQKDFHAIVNKSLSDPLSQTVTDFLRQRINIILGISAQDQDEEGTQLTGGYFSNRGTEENSRRELLAFVQGLQKVGLGGEKFQVIFARVMNDAMTSYVNSTYSKVWSSRSAPSPSPKHNRFSEHSQQFRSSIVGELNANDDGPLVPRGVNHSKPSEVVKELCEWVEDRFSRVAVEVLNKLDHMQVEWSDMDKWKEMCIGRLANLRTTELFDIVVNWPNSNGALEDLRTAITTPQRRLQLTDAFSAKLSERLLHPGTSTLQILRTYISMIWSFHSLDHSKVLLDRVAYPLQVYLCSREDTVKIIITGLLAEIEDADGNPIEPGEDSLSELAVLLNKGDEVGPRSDDELDWIVDMEWVPDPVDAGPGYKRSKNADVLGTLIGVLGSPDVFIKEFQRIIGDNLLKNEISFTREVMINLMMMLLYLANVL
jgi:anaphase-promoting complex subunit 2